MKGWRARGLLAAVLGLAALALELAGVASRLELPVRDLALRLLPQRAARHVAVVAIDEASLLAAGPWPWPREQLARLLEGIATAAPRGVAVDLLLDGDRPGDARLAEAMAAVPSVLAAALDGGGGWIMPGTTLGRGTEIACASFDPDHDGVMRRLVSTKQAGGRSLLTLAVAAATLAPDPRPVVLGRVLRPDFRTEAATLPIVAASSLLESATAPVLAGRIVFVGATAAGLGDRIVIPTSRDGRPTAGVIAQALAAEAVIGGHLLRPVAPLVAAALAVLVALVAAAAAGRAGGGSWIANVAVVSAPALALLPALAWLRLELPAVSLTAVAALAVLVTEARLRRSGERDVSTAAASLAAGLGVDQMSGKGERIAALTALAEEVRRRRGEEAEARRVLAHELKTPLTSVRGLTQLLSEYDLSPDEARRVAAMAAVEAGRLAEMIEGLLELERLPLQPFAVAAEPLDLGALATARVELLAAAGERRVRIEAAPGVSVRGSATLLARALDNLLGNALKYSAPDAPVRVRVTRRAGEAIAEVSDAGAGIPAAEREAIFRRFTRGSTAQGTHGLGLGLALVTEVVTWHHGRVEVDSEHGAGSTFRLVLPCAGMEG